MVQSIIKGERMEKETNPSSVVTTQKNGGRFRKGEKRPSSAGRKKGSPNKITKTVKEALEQAFEEVGGVEWLKNLAITEPKAFAVLLAKLIPSDINLSQSPVFKLINAVPDEDPFVIDAPGE